VHLYIIDGKILILVSSFCYLFIVVVVIVVVVVAGVVATTSLCKEYKADNKIHY